MKPSLGRVPNADGFPEPNLGISVVGVLATDVADAALVLETITAYDPRDPFSVPSLPVAAKPRPRIAWSADLGCGFAIDADVRAALESLVERLARDGGAIERADPEWPPGTGEYPLLAVQQAALATLFGETLATRRDELDPDIAAQIELGMRLSGAEIARALLRREAIAAALAGFFERYDLLLCPTAPVTAWPLDLLGPPEIGGRPAGPRGHAAFTPLVNYCGVPAVSVPAGLVRGLPIGLQVVGPRHADAAVLELAAVVEGCVPKLPPPPWGRG
jgi:aspartyl-tRNA(Asn)/glutamyl-tRNA(Gln) amidotransferase subunit A